MQRGQENGKESKYLCGTQSISWRDEGKSEVTVLNKSVDRVCAKGSVASLKCRQVCRRASVVRS
jgi:hypothetical protein